MGRKSKLTDAQWLQIERRMLEGESTRALAREFGVSESSIRQRKSAHVAEIKNVAAQIVETERALTKLPITAQQTAQNLAVKLRAISDNIASAAMYGAATAHRLSALANSEVGKIDDANPLAAESLEALKGVAVLTKLSNDSGALSIDLLNSHRDRVKSGEFDEDPVQPVRIILNIEDASRAEPDAQPAAG